MCNNDPLNIPLDNVLLLAEGRLEKQIAIASIFRPVDILKKGFQPKINQAVVEYWRELKNRKHELIKAGDDAPIIARSLIDHKTFYDWWNHDKPDVDDALKKLKAYRLARVCIMDIEEDLTEMMGRLWAT